MDQEKGTANWTSRSTIVRLLVISVLALGLAGGYFLSASHAAQVMKDQDYYYEKQRKVQACEVVTRLKNPTPEIGSLPMAPPPIRAQSMTGKAVDLSKYKGKWVLINFWATWCKTCKQEKPFLIDYTNRGDDVAVISVVTGSEWEKSKNMKLDQLPFQVIADAPEGEDQYGPIASAYKITGVPETFVIDPTGQIRYHFVGSKFWDWLGQSIIRCGLEAS